MKKKYPGVITRFLRDEERLILTQEQEMPLVIEAQESRDIQFLHAFIAKHSKALLKDVSTYGALLFRGFDIASDEAFEQSITKIQGFQGISEAFMSEEGRIHVPPCQYVLYTNAVYKTGGTLYLGGFHSENYYSADVPSYISFYCQTPSKVGGETGLIHMGKVYEKLHSSLKKKLENRSFFAGKWLVSTIAKRYCITHEEVIRLCKKFKLPLIGKGAKQFVLMYKPNVFEHPVTQQKALQINFFEIPRLNTALRKLFIPAYQGKTWFWHRLVWKFPNIFFKVLEQIYVMFASFFYSPKDSLSILKTKLITHWAWQQHKKTNTERVDSCFNDEEVTALAENMQAYYSSCLWQKGDILFVDNRLVVHAGMPGAGPRLVRALIGNPLAMTYTEESKGLFHAKDSESPSLGYLMTKP